jgi:hypothetical protein
MRAITGLSHTKCMRDVLRKAGCSVMFLTRSPLSHHSIALAYFLLDRHEESLLKHERHYF